MIIGVIFVEVMGVVMLFLAVFLSVYFGLNLYFFKKLSLAVRLGRAGTYILAGVFSISPVVYKFYDRAGFDSFYLSFSILLWMGFVLFFFVYHLPVDIYHGMLWLSHRVLGHNPLPHLPGKVSLPAVLSLAVITSAYGYYETINPEVYRFEIRTSKIDRDIKILHVSDLHLNQVMREDKIRLIKQIYDTVQPDILISTGDLVDGNLKDKDEYIKLLSQINPPLGKYAVLGNHEYYAGVQQAVEFTQKAGFVLLRDSYVNLPDNIVIAGVDDDEAVRFGVVRKYDDLSLLKNIDRDRFVIFLRHQPRIDPELANYFDLALCGHTHGGVLFPVKYILRRMFITDAGLVRVGSSYVFVSRGVGTGGPPIRVGAPPDVAVFYIKKAP